MNRTGKSPRSKAVAKLDTVFSQFIRLRDCIPYGKCCSCGKPITYEMSDAGHFINRRWMSCRWREDNVHAQCRSCNRFDEGNSGGYTLFMIKTYGNEHVEYLMALKTEYAGFKVSEIDLLTAEYKRKVKLLMENN